MLILQNISYLHPDKDLLFSDINLTVNTNEKIALIGNNGTGKSTLLRIIASELEAAGGQIVMDGRPYYVPQIFGQFNDLTIAQALRVSDKLSALKEILQGNTSEQNFQLLNDDWTIEDRCREALHHWQLTDLDLSQKMETLSGGQKTRVFLAGISIHQPELVLLDEPSNHLDQAARQILYDFIKSTQTSLVVVSHDRKLLNLLDKVCELNKYGIKVFGGHYDFYKSQKQLEMDALSQDIQGKEKALRKARETERESRERQQKLNSRGKAKQEKAGVARIMMNTLRNSAENSSARLKSTHADKINSISKELQQARFALPDLDKIRFGFENSTLHKGKLLFSATGINYYYDATPLWTAPLNLQIRSGERIALKGANGTGKTTLIKLMLCELESNDGIIYRAEHKAMYIDQDYSMVDNKKTVYSQAQAFNTANLEEHEIKIRLSRFLFCKNEWNKSCKDLSGGERMRLLLCCLTITNQPPEILILDEPTNNLDIENLEILTAAVNEYEGTLVVVAHDETFLEQINIHKTIVLG